MSFGGMQLLPQYRAQLDPRFLHWYFGLGAFTSTRMIYGHWPVECTDVDDDHYNDVVGEVDGHVKEWHNFETDPDDATWGRNTNSFAISLAGFADANRYDLGPQCPLPEEIDDFCAETARVCCNHRIPFGNCMSHGEAADNVDQGPNPPYPTPGLTGDDAASYGPLTTSGPHACERWDLDCFIDPVTRKLYAPQGNVPDGCLHFPDYWRGMVAALIQQMTRKYWAPQPSSENEGSPMSP